MNFETFSHNLLHSKNVRDACDADTDITLLKVNDNRKRGELPILWFQKSEDGHEVALTRKAAQDDQRREPFRTF